MSLLFFCAALVLPLFAGADLSDFKETLLAAAEKPQAREELGPDTLAALKKSSTRVAAPGVFEIDLDPGAGSRFVNPELALRADGRLLLDYARLHENARGFEALLAEAGIYQRMDASGVFRYYRGGMEISTFEAYGLLTTEKFLDDASFKPALTVEERALLRQELRSRDLIALPPAAPKENPRLFSLKTRELAALPQGRLTFPELHRALRDVPPSASER